MNGTSFLNIYSSSDVPKNEGCNCIEYVKSTFIYFER